MKSAMPTKIHFVLVDLHTVACIHKVYIDYACSVSSYSCINLAVQALHVALHAVLASYVCV